MNQGRKNIIIILMLIFCITAILPFKSNNLVSLPLKEESKLSLSGYTTSLPMIITNDAQLLAVSSSGTGDPESPYIIENLLIVTTDPVGIQIGATTKNFIIRDCYIEASAYGIFISSVADNTVNLENNTIYDAGEALHIESTNYVNISKNYLFSNGDGIYLESINYCRVFNNTCSTGGNGIYSLHSDYGNYTENILMYNSLYGLRLDESDNCNITRNQSDFNENSGLYAYSSRFNKFVENICQNNQYDGIHIQEGLNNSVLFNHVENNEQNGINIHTSSQNIVANNTAQRNLYHGINLVDAYGACISNNSITDDGFHVLDFSQLGYQSLTFTSNLVNDKPLGYLYGLGEIILSGATYGQLFLVYCSGTLVQNYTIHDSSCALQIIGGNRISIDNCNFENNYYGSIELENTINCTITNTKCNTNFGLFGINGLSDSNLTIFNCTANNNAIGFWLADNIDFNITSCNFDNNKGSQIMMIMANTGVIEYCGFTNGKHVGLNLMDSDYVNITYNFFEKNANYAIFLDGSDNNRIHHNAFISNNLGGNSQAYDDSANLNLWYDPIEMIGNYWDDWIGIGIYWIAGGSNNDSYPLGSIPPGVFEFKRISNLILLIPVLFISILLIRRKKRN